MSSITSYSEPHIAHDGGVYAIAENDCGDSVHIVRLLVNKASGELFYMVPDRAAHFVSCARDVGVVSLKLATLVDLKHGRVPKTIDSHGLVSFYEEYQGVSNNG